MQVLAECFKAIEFVIRHRQVCIPHADISTFGAASTAVIAGTFRKVQGRYFGRYDKISFYFSKSKFCTDWWLHLLTLFSNCLLEILRIVDAHDFIISRFINAKQKNTATILIRKTG